MSNLDKGRVYNILVDSGSYLMTIYWIILLAYIAYVAPMTPHEMPTSIWEYYIQIFLLVVIFGSIILSFMGTTPGRPQEPCLMSGMWLFVVVPIGVIYLLMSLINPAVAGFPGVTPYSVDIIAILLLVISFPLYILLIANVGRKTGPLKFKYEDVVYPASGKTLEAFHDVVLEVLNEYSEFDVVKRSLKGRRTLNSTTSGWFEKEGREGKVGVTVSLRGKKDGGKFHVKIEMGCREESELRQHMTEISSRLGYSEERYMPEEQ